MCDYSLEMYGSRPAREGERYVTTRFSSGSMGLASPGQPGTAVCMACDTRLAVSDIPAELAARHGFTEREEAIFVRLDSGAYRDGLRFSNGVELSLQQIPAGVSMELVPAEPVKLPIDEKIEGKRERRPELV
ncbi:hypothetical protein [Aestuariivirga sp.]|uniref:hypothetical protein n=1 Tax=Aestuariivirga sp. TaxID=2650926 RepID=UPI003593C7AB